MNRDSAVAAVQDMGHWAFAACEIETPDGKLHSEVPGAGKGGAS